MGKNKKKQVNNFTAEEQAQLIYIKSWAHKYGSSRLKKQLELGLLGDDLYLEERAKLDFKGFEKYNFDYVDGGDHIKISNPSEKHIDVAMAIADRLVKLGQCDDRGEALRSIFICYRHGENIRGARLKIAYVLVKDYRPGKLFDSRGLCFDLATEVCG